MKTPGDIVREILLPYQADWVFDDARFKLGMWARQTGKSFATAAEAVLDCLSNEGTSWVVLSAGERQALEWMEKARLWAKACKLLIDAEEEIRDSAEALLKSAEIRFANGSRILAIPANPNTARGYSANLILDEFAFHEKPGDIWKAIYPSISNPLKGELKLRIVSTPNGRGNKFYELWTGGESYSKHQVDIYAAKDKGLPVDIEALRAAIGDAEAWAQEYECEFIDSAAVLLPYEMITKCEHGEAARTWERGDAQGELYCGVDIGRKRDLTCCWTIEKQGDVAWTREVLILERTPFAAQLEALRPRIARSARSCIDATGIGAMLAEELASAYGDWKAEGCQFTAPFKSEIMMRLRRTFEDRGVRIPPGPDIREDLHRLQKVTSAAGNIRYLAPRSDDGHSDRATALALALHAADDGDAPAIYLGAA